MAYATLSGLVEPQAELMGVLRERRRQTQCEWHIPERVWYGGGV
jgi:hypothetical protein